MIKRISLIISAIFFIAAAIVFINALNKKNRSDKEKEISKEMIEFIVNRAEQYEKEILYNPVANQRCYFGKDSLNYFMYSDICDTGKLFFYFSDRVCTPCIDNTIKIIKKCFPNYKKDSSIIFISPDFPKRLADDCYGKRLLILKTCKLGLPLKEEFPFFFKLNSNLEVISVHVVVKVDFNRTIKYLQTHQRVKQ